MLHTVPDVMYAYMHICGPGLEAAVQLGDEVKKCGIKEVIGWKSGRAEVKSTGGKQGVWSPRVHDQF